MTKQSLFLFSLTFLKLFSFAQQGRQYHILPTASSKSGNYIHLVLPTDFADTGAFAKIEYFIIKRARITNAFDTSSAFDIEKQLKDVGVARLPKNGKDLRAILSGDEIQDFKKAFMLKTDDELIGFINKHLDPKVYFFFYHKIETKILLRHVFFDKDVKQGDAYIYYVYTVDKQNHQQLWGKTKPMMGKAGNYMLPYFKSFGLKPVVHDSSLTFLWQLPINIDYADLPKPSKRLDFDKEGDFYHVFFNHIGITAKVTCYEDGKWQTIPKVLFPQLNKTEDTLTYVYFKRCLPGTAVSAYITTQDDIYNEGSSSDTINAFVFTENNAPRILSFKVKDTLNALELTWNPVVDNPYLAGIQIIRYGAHDDVDTLPLLPIASTTYFDHDVKAGVNYRYNARLLYLPGVVTFQTMPASNFGTVTKFSRPAPPFNLTATNEGKYIRLNWKVANDPTIANFFVYRGLTPKKLNLLPGMIHGETYLDTTPGLKGAYQYYYAVSSQNLMQDTSIYSNLVSITPNRPININPPNDMSFYLSNGVLNVMWRDSRMMDNQIESFLVQKRKKGESEFSFLTMKPLNDIRLSDSAVEAGIVYQYRVASLSYKGDTSGYSEIFDYVLPKKRVEVLNNFTLSNSLNGIMISLPPVVKGSRSLFNIYRKSNIEKDFIKVASIPADQFKFEDTKVVNGWIYNYAITITESDFREGVKGMPSSIKRIKP